MAGFDFQEICTLGERADRLIGEQPAEAEAAYLGLMRRLIEHRKFDVFLMSKITLGLLLAKIERDDIEGARRVVNASADANMLLGMGVQGLEEGQTSRHDRAVFDFIRAYLCAHEPSRRTASKSLERTMLRLVKHIRANEPMLEPMALRNWKLHLAKIYKGRVPESAIKKLLAAERRYGRPVPSAPIRFPPPAPWIVDWAGPDAQATLMTRDGDVHNVSQESYASGRMEDARPSLLAWLRARVRR